MRRVEVLLHENPYPIFIGTGLLDNPNLIAPQRSASRHALVTNEIVWPLYGAPYLQQLQEAGLDIFPIVLPDGEIHKDWPALNRIFDALLENHCDRKTTLIALGGGVIGDITGFAAATYQRGVPFIQIPTTLLAQVDSSVGGKTAINHPRGKNMIGAFYQPRRVLADTNTLKTLPDREFKSGLAEVIKYGAGLDAAFFDWLEVNIHALLQRDSSVLTYAIQRSCTIKAQIVAADERETAKEGGRALLNLGHTFGHAIETALGYGQWLHGEAVGCGMALAARLSEQAGYLSVNDASRIVQLIESAGLPVTWPDISPETMLEHMSRDKKNESGAIRLILLKSIGQACVDTTISAAHICHFLENV